MTLHLATAAISEPNVPNGRRALYEREAQALRDAVAIARNNIRSGVDARLYRSNEANDLHDAINAYEMGTLALLRMIYLEDAE